MPTNSLPYTSKDKCQICSSSQVQPLITKRKDYNGKTYTSSWVECGNCGTAHIDPYPKEEDLLSYYSSGYLDMNFEGTSDVNSNHKIHYSEAYQDTVFENYELSLCDAGISVSNLKDKLILDYGCANGIFYKYLTKKCDVNRDNIYGVDVESDMLMKCRQISPNFYSSIQINQIKKKFNLITMWNVIEHIHDPKPVLKSLIDLLEDGGEIFIETPMYGSLAKKLGEDWSHYITIEHINLFSRSSIKKMFEDFGMSCISESSFGANIFAKIQPSVKKALDQMAKEKDFGATQVLRFVKN